MSRLGPLYAALAFFPLLAAGAALPYVAAQYRRNGTVGAGHLVLAGAFALYLVGLAFTVILPLRPVTPDFCTVYGVDPELNPLFVVDQARAARADGGLGAVIRDGDVRATVLNVFLFVPLGMLARHLLRRGFATTVVIGFAVSLLIELTQLTGNWGLYPCAYRFFATADLITNTAGAAIGAAIAPLLRLIPAQEVLAKPAEPQPVTPNRRLLAVALNGAAMLALGFVLLAVCGLLLDATRGQLFESDAFRARALRATTLVIVPGILLLLATPLVWRGQTPGEWAVLLEPAAIGAGRTPPGSVAIVLRFLSGPGPLLLAAALALLGFEPAWFALALLALLNVLFILRARRWRDGVELRIRMRLVDSR